MNPGQEKSFTFIVERVQAGTQEDAEVLRNESFGRQANGASHQTYLDGFTHKMTALLKPESITEVEVIMS